MNGKQLLSMIEAPTKAMTNKVRNRDNNGIDDDSNKDIEYKKETGIQQADACLVDA
jgi:hypothetical protein